MDRVADERARRVLTALAGLSPSEQHQESRLSIPTEWFTWLSAESVRLFAPNPYGAKDSDTPLDSFARRLSTPGPDSMHAAFVDRRTGGTLAAIDRLRTGERNLRVGWLFVAGRAQIDADRSRRVFFPLVSVPVRVWRASRLGEARLEAAGDVQVSELVADDERRHEFESRIEFGGGALEGTTEPAIPAALLGRLSRLQGFASAAAAACGFPTSEVVPVTSGPERMTESEELVIVAGVGIYAVHGNDVTSRAGSLRNWAAGPLDTWSAFHSTYAGTSPDTTERSPAMPPKDVESPFVLTEAQRMAVTSARTAPISVLSGAPGTGKSHTVVAIACDALARGESVLVAAKSDASVDALLDLLERAPGPDPVVFGANERRDALAKRLASGQVAPVGAETVATFDERRNAAWETHRVRYESIRARLSAARAATRGDDERDALEQRARLSAPALFDPVTDLDGFDNRLAEFGVTGDGRWARWRSGRRLKALAEELGGPGDTTTEELREALRAARAQRATAALEESGGLRIGDDWDSLDDAEELARESTAKWLAAATRSTERLDRRALLAIAALATALRSGRAARREQLARLDDDVTRALPLWVGSLGDIDDLLPARAGLFDLVLLDEASSVDQPMAAPALLRGRRGVVVGDPQQLRHVSFLADDQIRDVLTQSGLDSDPLIAAQLDVRRNSAFDAAAAVAPVMTLDEQFRSAPHLIEYVADRLYGGRLKVATRAPSTQSKCCIDVVRLEGRRAADGTLDAEIAWVVRWLRSIAGTPTGTVGIVTPFRAQADALEKRIVHELSGDVLDELDVRVGTVHAFQGNERDVVVVSLGLDAESTAASWRFVEDPHLFAVLATRARRHVTMLVSGDPPPGGLVAGYLAQADTPPGPPASTPPKDPWVRDLASALADADVPIICGYPTGRHRLDIVPTDQDLFIESTIHPDGPDDHVARHLALMRSGWRIAEAYESRWGDRRGELVVDLLEQINRRRWRSNGA
jgi:hypothetical protein